MSPRALEVSPVLHIQLWSYKTEPAQNGKFSWLMQMSTVTVVPEHRMFGTQTLPHLEQMKQCCSSPSATQPFMPSSREKEAEKML